MFQLLIVDDYPDQVESIAVTLPLEELEIEVVYKAYSGMEALEILKSNSIDIVITDIKMPGMSGLELIAAIRAASRATKCILLSGYAEFELAQQAIQLQTSYYLMKPVETEELIGKLRVVVDELKGEWEEIASYRRAMYTFRENRSLIGGELLNHLLQERRYPASVIANKMNRLELPFAHGDPVGMFLVRMEDGFERFDDYDLSLMEFAVANMAEEIFGEHFYLWHCKDTHDYLVFVLKEKADAQAEDGWSAKRIEKHAAVLHKSASLYLNSRISVCAAGDIGFFPDFAELYQACLSAIRKKIGDSSNFFITAARETEQSINGGLKTLYRPPLLIHLLEIGRWDKVAEKLDDIFAELEGRWTESSEYAQEIFMVIASSFHFIAHKNGRSLRETIGAAHHGMLDEGIPFQSIKRLREWTNDVLLKLREDAARHTQDSRSAVIHKIHQFVDQNVSRDLSHQAISEQVNLHPAYLSKVYKMETGVNLSEYLLKYRMELAARMLQEGNDRIYEIAAKTGYQTTHYFIKLFKNYYGVTPQEYREKSN